jgi:hypothetical protein
MNREPGRAPADSGAPAARTARGSPQLVAAHRAGAYWTMYGFPLFAVIAAVVDWSRFRWA